MKLNGDATEGKETEQRNSSGRAKGELKGKGGRQAGKPKVDDDIIMLKNVLGLHVES